MAKTGYLPGNSHLWRMVDGYLDNMLHIFSGESSKDPWLDKLGRIDFQIIHQLCTYLRVKPPPDHVCLVPVYLLHKLWRYLNDRKAKKWVIYNLLFIGFLFLCQPCECCKWVTVTHLDPFSIVDIQFFCQTATPSSRQHTPLYTWLNHLCIPKLQWSEKRFRG